MAIYAVVIGAGLSGLAAALTLQRSGFTRITVLEKRSGHTRDNYILLNHLGTCRLRQLGVYEAWNHLFDRRLANCEEAITRGELIEQLVQQLKETGRLAADAPDDYVSFCFDNSVSAIVTACEGAGVPVDSRTGLVDDFEQLTPEMMSELQQRAVGVKNVKIKELEHALAYVCRARGIEIVYNCGDVTLRPSSTRDAIVHVKTSKGVAIDTPSLVVVCEGAQRTIAKQQLRLREVRSSASLWFVMFELQHYYGPRAFTVINVRDKTYPSTRLRHALIGNFQSKQHSLCSFQLPRQFMGDLDDDDDGHVLRQYCLDHLRTLTAMHGLPDPPPDSIGRIWTPFECRETYLENAVYGNNTLVIGDAARSGTFLSGTGYNFALVNDMTAVEVMAKHILAGEASSEATATLMAQLDDAIRRTSRFFCESNLEKYY
ncbi:hypothetical protein Poli38472_008325 [Pythium oligandrum]|uniref:FAD dependent oxidoreductase domain-containing protein n=1 Tax=Pythium oligandrum TaxID=41045 RepID=A0A8K1FPJ2_PYTOL|nr:hypothetical protein Poli38472_008325 [Pythium oligandrum]|eukprot:TMW65683.1 hypothetical protein Poli38472_008325 [Pythium oligandrum]